MRALIVMVLAAACGPQRAAPEAVVPATETVADAGGGAAPVEPPAAPDAAPVASGACQADAQHCCLPDGRIVKPGGCQPEYPAGVEAATERNADGTCRRIECYERCLPAATRIATPGGDVPVDQLAVGDAVWTVDRAGARVEARVLRVSSVPVSAAHEVLELTLGDGRVVRASGGHPDAAGATLSSRAVGDVLDGAAIRSIRAVPYGGSHTWDLLPSGPTGAYWADGVLLGSTLR